MGLEDKLNHFFIRTVLGGNIKAYKTTLWEEAQRSQKEANVWVRFFKWGVDELKKEVKTNGEKVKKELLGKKKVEKEIAVEEDEGSW